MPPRTKPSEAALFDIGVEQVAAPDESARRIVYHTTDASASPNHLDIILGEALLTIVVLTFHIALC